MADLRHEIERRRTFAIISHPDAGKTTLTEKFLEAQSPSLAQLKAKRTPGTQFPTGWKLKSREVSQ